MSNLAYNSKLYTNASHMQHCSKCYSVPYLYPGTIKTLLEELEDISGSEWFKLGHWLGVKNSTLRDIEADHKGDVWRCKREMLCAWLQSSPTIPWVKLATTLKCMGNEVLAQKILEKYTTP